jgi:membrane protein required for beta-lactamase induction
MIATAVYCLGAAGVDRPVAAVQAASAQQASAADPNIVVNPAMFQGLRFRSVGPHRGGRVTAIQAELKELGVS